MKKDNDKKYIYYASKVNNVTTKTDEMFQFFTEDLISKEIYTESIDGINAELSKMLKEKISK